MAFNPGPIICTTTAAVTHNKKINQDKEETSDTNYTSTTNKYMNNYNPVNSPKEILEELKSNYNENGIKLIPFFYFLCFKSNNIIIF